jgi:hypothetical protein
MNILGFITFVGFVLVCRFQLSTTGTAFRTGKSIALRSRPLWALVAVIPSMCWFVNEPNAMGIAFVAASVYYSFRFGWHRRIAVVVWLAFVPLTGANTGFNGTLIGLIAAFCLDMTWNWWMKKTDAWFKEDVTPLETKETLSQPT